LKLMGALLDNRHGLVPRAPELGAQNLTYVVHFGAEVARTVPGAGSQFCARIAQQMVDFRPMSGPKLLPGTRLKLLQPNRTISPSTWEGRPVGTLGATIARR
jgi:hypothetical protein